MRTPGLLLAGSLSFLPFVAAYLTDGTLRLQEARWTAVALAPWLALAGWPHGARSTAEPRLAWMVPAALALPAVGLGLGPALGGSGGELVANVLVAAGGLALVLAWSANARRAAVLERRTAYGLAWLVAVPGAAAAIWAVDWAPGGGSGAWSGALELALPLPWLAHAATRGGEAGRLLVGLGGNLVVAWILGAFLRAAGGPARGEHA